MQPFIAGEKPAIAERYLLTSLAGHLAFSDVGEWENNAAAKEVARKGAEFILPTSPDSIVRFPTQWTDDMFMATSVLARVAARSGDPRYAPVIGRLLTSVRRKAAAPRWALHPRAGRAAPLGTRERLRRVGSGRSAHLPAAELGGAREGARDLPPPDAGLRSAPDHDGSWRQVVDEPTAYQELTVTAMITAAMARGVRLGWLDRNEFLPVIEKGWRAVAARVNEDGTVRDVCSGTGAMPTKEYYMTRPVVNGADDRGGAMALLAALEVEELRRSGL